MRDRVVKVSFTAQVSNYVANMKEAGKATEKVTQTLEQQKAASIAAAKAQGEAAAEIGRGMVAVGAIAAVGVGLAVKKFADFDEAISNVKAATQETSGNMVLLRDASLDAGASTVFSATEAANAVEQLGKNGLSTANILTGGLDGALDLASAGQLEVARAAEIAAISMKQFGLEGKDIPHIADLLAAGAGKAAGDVEDLAQALNQSALVAAQTGLSIEDTTGTLAAFADAGLVGSDAGTAFKSMLQRLTPVSAESALEMDRLGISAYDAQGNFIGIEKFAGNLQDRLKGLTSEQRNAALAQIFGTDAVRSAARIYELGADGIKRYIDQTNDSGFAAKVAADRLDNLKGDVEQLGGALDTYLIKSGSGANDTLRALTQGATGIVAAVGELPEPVLGGALALGGLVAAIALSGGAALIAVPKYAQFKTALVDLKISGASAARGIGLASTALAIAGIAFSMWAAKQAEATATTREFQDSLDGATGATTDYTRELVAMKLSEAGAFENAKKYGIDQKELTDAVLEGGAALESVKAKLDAAGEGLRGNQSRAAILAARYGSASTAVDELSGYLEESREDLENQKAAADGSAEGTAGAAAAYQDAADKAAELQSNLTKLIDTVNKSNDANVDAITANTAYQQTLIDARTAVAEYAAANGVSTAALDTTTQAGIDNTNMLADMASKSRDAAQAALDAGGSAEDYRKALDEGRQAIYDTALALTGNADAAQALADKIYAMPTPEAIEFIAETAEAQRRIQALKDSVNAFRSSGVTLSAYVNRIEGGYAGGGTVRGPGTSKSDSVVTRLSVGEEVIQEPYASRNRPLLKAINSGYAPRGFANGGTVGGYVQPTYASSSQYAMAGSSVVSGDTWAPVFQIIPQPDRPVADQVFEAVARMRIRR